MRGRGKTMAMKRVAARPALIALALSLMLAWPLVGAGQGGGDQRRAFGLSLRVDVAVTNVADDQLEAPHR